MLHKWLRFVAGSAATKDDLDSSSLCLFWGLSRLRQEISARKFSIAPWNCTSASARCYGQARISQPVVTLVHQPHALLSSCAYLRA